jgi:CBS domain containing-hemolysin-like protein
VYSKLDENNYIFEGKTPLNDFYRVLDLEPEILDEHKGDAETLAGLMIEIAGYLPSVNEELTVSNLIFKVESIEKRRIRRLKISRIQKSENE